MDKKTPCECPLAGYCNRHEVTKNGHLHRLCQTNIKYFNLWEKCKGPLQNFVDCIRGKKRIKNEETPEKAESEQSTSGKERKDTPLPSKLKMAKNLAKETAKHVGGGMKNVSQEVYEERLNICGGCEFFRSDRRCGKCGCFMDKKAKWKTSACPIGKWKSQ